MTDIGRTERSEVVGHTSDQFVKERLREIEAIHRLSFRGVPNLLRVLANELFAESEVPDCKLKWEFVALGLYLSDEPTHWGTQHGPSTSWQGDDGEKVDLPPLAAFTAECLEYCRHRMADAEHPVLKARYADVVWDLTKAAQGNRPPIASARIAIDAYLEAVLDDRIDPPGWHGEQIDRMMSIAVSIGDDDRLAAICESLNQYAASGRDGKEIEWRQRDLFPHLLRIPKKKWPQDIIEQLAADLRARLESLNLGTGKQWAFQRLALPLAEFYWSTNQKEDAQAVVKIYGGAVLHEAEGAQAMMATGWIEQLHKLYRRYELHDDAAGLLRMLEQRQSEMPEQLARFSTPVELKKEEVDALIDLIVTKRLNETLANLVQCFWVRVESEREAMLELEKEHPLLATIPQALLDHDGRKVAAIGGADDEEGRLIRHICQNLRFQDVFLRLIFPELIRRHALSPDALLAEIVESPLWSENRHAILDRGVKAFLDDDALVAIHLLIPEVEAAVRNLAGGSGVVLQKPHRNGGYVLKNLDDLLREKAVVLSLTEDMALYLRIVLTDQRGWNLRNVVCHGLFPANQLNGAVARRVMMIVFFLSSFRVNRDENETSEDD